MSRRFLIRGPALIGTLLLTWGAARAVVSWHFHSELGRARSEVSARRFPSARSRLLRLESSQPGHPDVEYWLGLCEEAEGRPEAAAAALARVPSGTPLHSSATNRRDRLLRRLLERGQLSTLETILEADRRRGGAAAREAAGALERLLRLEGRTDEVRRLLQQTWEQAPDRAVATRELWLLDAEPLVVGDISAFLSQAYHGSPDDDRVWLGWANLANWTGRTDEGGRWLDACLRRRPDDPAVWHARLEWAHSAGRADLVEQALAHLPADRFGEADALALRAWLVARRNGAGVERVALEKLIELAPADAQALERLAGIYFEAGQEALALKLRARKAEVDRARQRYRQLLAPDRTIKSGELEELGRLAEGLGRWFEARAWWMLAARRQPENQEAGKAVARLELRLTSPRAPAVRTLAELVAVPPPNSASARPAAPDGRAAALPVFEDDAEQAGLVFRFDNGQSPTRQLPETMSGGVGLIDYDGDGWLDVYLVQGGPFPPAAGRQPNRDRLFRNLGSGRFRDVTSDAGLADMPGGYGHGVAVGDYDNDGHPDLFVTRFGAYALYHNQSDGTFRDVTAVAGLGGDRDWPTSAALADLDDDGDLDLYVCHYLTWDAEHPRLCPPDGQGMRRYYCEPNKLPAQSDHLFRNDGGTFVDVTARAGIVDENGRGLGVVAADLDGDGRTDLYVANDMSANFLFRNRGGLEFEEVGLSAGVACNAEGGYQAGMGVGCGDQNGDGLPDLVVTNFFGESTTLFRNLGQGTFADQTRSVGLAAASRALLGFGVAFLDFDDDGSLDLATANGHVNDYSPNVPYAMPAQLLAGGEGGRLRDVSAGAGPAWGVRRVGRGLAVGDLDNDGRLDLLIVSQGEPLAYLHNRTTGGHSLTLRLEGTVSNRDAVGARVTLVSGGRRQVAQRTGGGSYLSASDPRLHFGLGARREAETVEIRWPSGQLDRYHDLPADAGYLLREGHAEPEPLSGFPRAKPRHGPQR